MKLKVVAGAKTGTEIPLKKSKFIIGRASDCTLRAGSEAISRHHCVLLREESAVSIRDLGSRNGTYVNDEVIEGETALAHGDRVRVGPLEFIFEGAVDLAREKKPKVKNVAEALERTAEKSAGSATVAEDDISAWLLGPAPGAGSEAAMKETQTFRMDDTRAIATQAAAEVAAQQESAERDSAEETAEQAPGENDGEAAADESDEQDSGKKKKPGKLPKLPPKPLAKDSREAAADILRELARRR